MSDTAARPEVLPAVRQVPALSQLRAFVSHGVQDQKLDIHFARNAKQVLDGLGVPVQYQEYPAGHELNTAMLGDFTQWLGHRLDQGNAQHPTL